MSFSASILILVVIVIRLLAINKLPKKTFLAFWVVALLRLLIPFSFPSPFSVYSVISNNTTVTENIAGTLVTNIFPMTAPMPIPSGDITTSPDFITTVTPTLSSWAIIWIVGVSLCALYFVIAYIKGYKGFQTSTVIQNDFIIAWLAEHKIVRPISIRQSGQISSPLTYGIFRPVILVPLKMDWSDETQLQYILTHEYMHIRSFDAVTKLFLTAALCIHWFNPLVWVMYILSNRDIELSCDEAVVRSFGEIIKSSYAYILVGMEEKKSGLTPYYNSFSKNAIEERIIAIMKIKKYSLIAVLIAIIMVAGVTTVFATSAEAQSINLLTLNAKATLTTGENDELLTLKFDGYQNMSIYEYRSKVVEMLENSMVYSRLMLERMWENEDFEKMRYTDEVASFFFDTLMPIVYLPQGRFFSYPNSTYSTHGNGIILKYTLLDENQLTVGEYSQTMQGFMNDLYLLLKSKGVVDLENENNTNTAIREEIEQLKGNWESNVLQFDIEYGNFSIRPFGSPNEA